MTHPSSGDRALSIRSIHLKDLDQLRAPEATEIVAHSAEPADIDSYIQQMRRWYGPIKALTLFPNPFQHVLSNFVAEAGGVLQGMVQVSPFNRTLSTWKIDRMLLNLAKGTAKEATARESGHLHLAMDVGSQLLKHCFETIREAQYWISETDVNDQFGLALYRQSGFQPLARATYWSIEPEQLQTLAERDPDLPNLLPVNNADAQLIYQLETVSIPPLVRQVLDYQIQDFKTTLPRNVKAKMSQWASREEIVAAYVFEPQRKTAIGYFKLTLRRDGISPHTAKLTVHPAYTWLYPELMSQMAGVVQKFPEQPLQLMSLDYQTEREEYLRRIGALEIEHTLMMSRSVWHKVREAKSVSLEGLKLPDVLPGLQPTGTPLPGRFSWHGPTLDSSSHDGLVWDCLAWDRFWLENMSKLSLDRREERKEGRNSSTERSEELPE